MLNGANAWDVLIHDEFKQPYMRELCSFLKREAAAGKTVCPTTRNMFRVFREYPRHNTKVLILDQEPYSKRGLANGRAYAVNEDVRRIPGVLKNILSEVKSDVGTVTTDQTLDGWAKQGVLLLNLRLSTIEGVPEAHVHHEWESFTRRMIEELLLHRQICLMLWGSKVQKFLRYSDSWYAERGHLVLTASHPNVGSRGFFGCRHFSKCNQWLKEHQMSQIEW